MDSRYLLFGYYFFRGLSLLVVPWLLGPHVQPSLFLCLAAAALCLLVPRRMPFPDADPEPVGHESVPDVG